MKTLLTTLLLLTRSKHLHVIAKNFNDIPFHPILVIV